jgi:hypothetical protein
LILVSTGISFLIVKFFSHCCCQQKHFHSGTLLGAPPSPLPLVAFHVAAGPAAGVLCRQQAIGFLLLPVTPFLVTATMAGALVRTGFHPRAAAGQESYPAFDTHACADSPDLQPLPCRMARPERMLAFQ